MLNRWRAKRKCGDGRGQATLEFALVVLVLLVVLFGIIDFSRLFFAYATMANGVREGARYGVVHQDPSWDEEIENRARAMMLVVGGDAVITVQRPGGDRPEDRATPDPGDPSATPPPYPEGCSLPYWCRITVRAESVFDVWTPLIPSFTIVAQATMHFE